MPLCESDTRRWAIGHPPRMLGVPQQTIGCLWSGNVSYGRSCQADEQLRMGETWTDTGLVFTKENGEAIQPRGRKPLPSSGSEARGATDDPPARSAPHSRDVGSAGRDSPQGRLRTPGARHHLNHARHLLARDSGNAGGGGDADRRPGVCRQVDCLPASPHRSLCVRRFSRLVNVSYATRQTAASAQMTVNVFALLFPREVLTVTDFLPLVSVGTLTLILVAVQETYLVAALLPK